MASMFVFMAGKMMKNDREDDRKEAKMTIESQEFRVSTDLSLASILLTLHFIEVMLNECLTTILLSPNLTAYQMGLAPHVIVRTFTRKCISAELTTAM